jgi:hypothetical protein
MQLHLTLWINSNILGKEKRKKFKKGVLTSEDEDEVQ